jgi:short-subunit dehydrogenase involved in D-alanine esterification of teichoic acids
LFNIGLEEVMRSIEINAGGTIFKRTKQFMVYANDVAIIGRTEEKLNKSLRNYEQLVINTDETKHSKR